MCGLAGMLLPAPAREQAALEEQARRMGDALVQSISAASILAKVTRDRWCQQLHQQYPQYGFDAHKGYGTAVHLAALREHGACPEHRRSFAPVAQAGLLVR